MKPGKVYLGGAGPGDPGLVTLRLLEVLRTADVILYDRLLDRSILREAKESAEIADVGKGARGGGRGAGQRDINRLLIEHASRGKTVLRLKGGDPFVFGRGAEECEALAAAGIPFEVIPGVTSASAVPAYAGIPLTHRDYSSSFAVATGHLKKGFDFSHLKVPQADTLVYLMGVGNLPKLVEKIIEAGWPEEAPAALIQQGTRGSQRTAVGTLDTIAEKAKEEGVEPPAVLVVGEVVGLRDRLSWFESKTLFGRRIVVTRATEKQGPISNALRTLGAEVLECPAITIRPLAEARRRFCAPGDLDPFTDIVFTSENGVRLFFEHLMGAGGDARSLAGKRLAAIGPSTAESLKAHGITADLVPATYTAEGVVDRLEEDLSGRHFLLPRAKGARQLLPEEITRRGGTVEEWLLYEAVPPEIDTRELRGADALLFTSSSTVRNLCRAGTIDRGIPAICIGSVTARTAEDEGFSRVHVSAEATIDSLLEKMVEVLRREKK